jgi:hypothetical protein
MKTRPVGAELLRAGRRTDGRTDGRTDIMKLTVAFHNFAKAPKRTNNSSTQRIIIIIIIIVVFCSYYKNYKGLNLRSSIPDNSDGSIIDVDTGIESVSHVRGNGSKYD